MRRSLVRQLAIATAFSCLGVAQEQAHYFSPMPSTLQVRRGQGAEGTGAVGLTATKTAQGFTVSQVVPGGPADKAGFKTGDVITKINGKLAGDLSQAGLLDELRKKPGEKISLYLSKGGQEFPVQLTVEARSTVYPQEAKMPPAVTQVLFDGHASLTAALAQDNPQRVTLWLFISNVDLPRLALDDAKFFVLDGSRQQLHHVTLDEIRYSIQTFVAQNMRSGSYPPPPPPAPSHQYTITGSENGVYTVNSLGGGFATINGSSTSSYTVTQQPDYNQLGYSLGLAIRQYRDRKHDEKLMQQAQQSLNSWTNGYLKSETPMIPGENRTGGIMYWSAQGAKGPFRVVLFVSDPMTGKDEQTAFDFQ